MATQQVILDTTIKSVGSLDIRGRGRLAWVVVDAPHIPFTVAVGRRDPRLLVDGVQIERFEVPHVSGAADALGSFGMIDAAMPPEVKAGARVTVVLAGETASRGKG